MTPLVEVKNLNQVYQPSKDVVVKALNNITLSIDKGEFVAILGSSGSGKSTLLYIIGLLEKATTGSIHLNGDNVSILKDSAISKMRNKMIGFVFQQFNLIPKLTVWENVILPTAYSPDGTTPSDREYCRYLLTAFGIFDKRGAYPNQLSGGQQQRVAIARALVNKPDIIIADEPTGNLDSKTGQQIMKLIKEIHAKEGKTIILVTHDHKIANYADRIIRIKDGFVVKNHE